MTGRIHSFETLGALDGPGMRCVVFMQGCPMRCAYCQNPDTWNPAGGTKMSVRDVVRRIEKCAPYFGLTGGVTLSGGEPLLQPEFTAEIFRQCREQRIHTALDTSGSIVNDAAVDVLNVTDLVILDIKHTDAERHKALTGRNLDEPMRFLEMVTERKIPLWVRQVIVPGWNHTDADAIALARILSGRKSLEKIELLPYHEMARQKWRDLGMNYPLENTPTPDAEMMRRLQSIIDGAVAEWG